MATGLLEAQVVRPSLLINQKTWRVGEAKVTATHRGDEDGYEVEECGWSEEKRKRFQRPSFTQSFYERNDVGEQVMKVMNFPPELKREPEAYRSKDAKCTWQIDGVGITLVRGDNNKKAHYLIQYDEKRGNGLIGIDKRFSFMFYEKWTETEDRRVVVNFPSPGLISL